MNSIESLVEQLTTDENKQRLVSFFGVVNDILKKPQQVNIEENDDSSLVVFQKNGQLFFNVTSGFIKALGKNTLSVYGEIDGNVVYRPKKAPEKFEPTQRDRDRLLKTYIVFEPNADGVVASFNDEIITQIPDINIVNMIKRNNLVDESFQMVKNKLNEFGVKYYVVGDVWPETSSVVDNIKTVYVDRPVITEKIVEVQKIVLKEVPVYVDKIVFRDVLVQTPATLVQPATTVQPLAAIQVPMSEVLDATEVSEEVEETKSTEETSEETSSEEETSEEETSEEEEESSTPAALGVSRRRKFKFDCSEPGKMRPSSAP